VLALIHVTGIGARYAAMLALDRAPNLDVLLLGYANPRFPTAFYALLMPFVATLALDPLERVAVRRLGLVVLVFLWSANIALGTRAIWFAYALALPLMVLVVGWRKIAPAALVLAGTAAGGFCIYQLLFVGIPVWLDLGSALPSHLQHLVSISDRIYLWRQSWSQILAHPLLGAGPMHMAALGDSFASHPHNWVLQVSAEWGVPALVALCWALWRFASNLRTQLRKMQNVSGDLLAPLAAVAIGLCYGLVDGNLVMPVSQITFALMLGALLGAGSAVLPDTDSARRPIVALVAILVVASAGFLLAYVVDTLPRQGESESAWRQTSKYSEQAPRFWQQGLLR
jgi:O-antigen ligase